ncbi:hypothetical protein HWX16_16315 [Ochrobactrum intermedium]|uniref:hypothetical protein n=1 Tax=Brucella intermedia TaxID=94625 RepID=UPI00159C9DB3|nr:hypothetical protein [Brucella intermedia]NVM41893.1 hypothetical protein [Brucella intermedia]
MADLLPCPFCSKTMMLRSALWPSEGDADAIIHAFPTDCPMVGFSDGSADGSIIEKWNCSLSNEDDFPSDGSCVRCGSVPRNANGLCNTCLDEDAERLENTRPTPVAPVSPDATGKCGELETVAQAHFDEFGEFDDIAWIKGFHPHPECVQLVTRSQAEELLSAERAKKEMLAESLHIQIKRVNELEADNAALTARVKELERHISLSETDHIRELRLQRGLLWKEKEALEAKLAAAEKALEPFVSFFNEAMKGFTEGYAERTPFDKPVLGWNNAYLLMQHFIEARAVLGGKPS